MAGAQVRKAPYKDFLQPALQRRFSSTAAVLLVVSYFEALVQASWSSYFWAWFPLGSAGFRTACIFSCGLLILTLRIANYHVGVRTSGPSWQTLTSSLTAQTSWWTLLWYTASALFFGLVFVLSAPTESNLQTVNYYAGDRARLNERRLFLLYFLASCAGFQTLSHVRRDTDRLILSPANAKGEVQEKDTGSSSESLKTVLRQLPNVLVGCVQMAILSYLGTLFFYHVFMRGTVWSIGLMLSRPFYNMPKTNILPPVGTLDVWLLLRCVEAGTLLYFLWESGNTAFSTFMVKAPLKAGQALTFESKDPNGSLLNGLKSKKLPIKSFAMWELAHVAEKSAERRSAIFQDIDRKDGPMWSQIYGICMETLQSIEARVDTYGKAPAPPPAPAPEAPRQRSTAPLRDDPIFNSKSGPTTMLGGMEKAVGQVARAPDTSPISKLSPVAKKMWKEGKDRMWSQSQQEAVSADHAMSQLGDHITGLLKNDYVGVFFRREFRTEFAAAVLGTPYAEPSLYVNAIIALCQLSANSLSEDSFGNVHRDVPSVIRTLTAVVKKVEALKGRFPTHWTDVKGSRDTPEVDQVLEAARSGLEQVVAKFEPYSTDLRLSLTDIRLAKEAATKPQIEKAKPKKDSAESQARIESKPESKPKRISRREDRRPEMEQVR